MKRRVVLSLACAALGLSALVPACLAPTQVTLEIRKDPQTKCEDLHETSIVVAVDAPDAEARMMDNFFTATTTSCDPVTNTIGTLVVTPSDAGRASVVVSIASGAKTSTSQCKTTGTSEDFADCIFARRRFAFADHERLTMPITIDIDCRGKPCDAYSTCRKGACYSSEAERDGSSFREPDKTSDGGADGGPPPTDGATDGLADAPRDGGPTLPYCGSNDALHCHGSPGGADAVCANGVPCCDSAGGPTCGAPCTSTNTPFCCTQADCASPTMCIRPSASSPGRCIPPTLPKGYCDPKTSFTVLHCEKNAVDTECSGQAHTCCQRSLPYQCDSPDPCVGPKHCCVDADCPVGNVCNLQGAPSLQPGTCGPAGVDAPYCDMKDVLFCPTTACPGPANKCCSAAGAPAVCSPGNQCLATEKQLCCAPGDCPAGKTCPPAPIEGLPMPKVVLGGIPVGGSAPRYCQ